jgi:hypothetical protein
MKTPRSLVPSGLSRVVAGKVHPLYWRYPLVVRIAGPVIEAALAVGNSGAGPVWRRRRTDDKLMRNARGALQVLPFDLLSRSVAAPVRLRCRVLGLACLKN